MSKLLLTDGSSFLILASLSGDFVIIDSAISVPTTIIINQGFIKKIINEIGTIRKVLNSSGFVKTILNNQGFIE